MTDRADLLYLVHRVPFPPDKGDRIRNFHVLRFLSQHARVHLACLADEPVPDETLRSLSQYCERVTVVSLRPFHRFMRAASSLARGHTVSEGAFYSPQLSATLGTWARQTSFRAALASASSMVPYLDSEALRNVPAVVDMVDVDSQKWLDYAATSRRLKAMLYRLEGRRLRRLEQALADRTRAVTLVSEAEVKLYRRFCSEGTVHAISNGVDLEYFRPNGVSSSSKDDNTCIFVGALDYRPNVDGACWFCAEVWPEILQRCPNAKLLLVGRRPAPAVRRLTGQRGVEVVGQVPDVRPYLAGSSVVVVPLRLARGVQNKVLEALAMGKAVVASPQSLQGIRALPGTHLLSADSADEWVAATLRLFEDAALREQLGLAGRDFVQEHHHWDQCLEPFATLLGLVGRQESSASAFSRTVNGAPVNFPPAAPHPGVAAISQDA